MRLALASSALAALTLLVGLPQGARAQAAFVVSDCSTVSGIPTGGGQPLVEDQTGKLCGSPGAGAGTQDVNLKQVNGAAVNVGTGAAGTGTQRVTTSTDSTIGTVTAVTAITNALPAGSNVIGHVIVDTTSTTAVTQATAANLNAQVQGVVAAGVAPSGNPLLLGGSDGSVVRTLKTDGNGVLNGRVFGNDSAGGTAGSATLIVGGVANSVATLPSYSTGQTSQFQTDIKGILLTGRVVPGVAITAASGNVANASAVATLAGVAAKTTYIQGFQCSASGATAASVASLTVAGVITGTMTYTFVFPAGVTTVATPLVVNFAAPIPASAANTAIVVTLPAGGSGNTNATCNAQGFQL